MRDLLGQNTKIGKGTRKIILTKRSKTYDVDRGGIDWFRKRLKKIDERQASLKKRGFKKVDGKLYKRIENNKIKKNRREQMIKSLIQKRTVKDREKIGWNKKIGFKKDTKLY